VPAFRFASFPTAAFRFSIFSVTLYELGGNSTECSAAGNFSFMMWITPSFATVKDFGNGTSKQSAFGEMALVM
jgi:hypothetical protein